MAQGQDDVRRELEKTRESIGRTVEALANKANPRGRKRSSSAGRRSSASRRSSGNDQDMAWGIAAAGFAGGILLGSLLPRSRAEDEAIGPLADEIKRPAKRAASTVKRQGSQAARRGKQAARSASKAASSTAKKTARRASKTASSAARKAKKPRG